VAFFFTISLWMYTMNRCFPRHGPARGFFRSALGILALTVCLGSASVQANAQNTHQRVPPIAANTVRGVLQVNTPPEVLLDGLPARLSPGARIRGRNNLLVLSATLVGQVLPVRYVLDTSGLVHQVWILTDAELQEKP
jgi:hypothetical protein